MLVQIEVNSLKIEVEKGEMILSVLSKAGIKIPTLCSMKDLSPTGACRMCVVEVEGIKALVPSCSSPVEENMQIKTHSPRVIRARKSLVELLLSNHPDDCLYCERNGSCELQSLAADLNVRERRIPGNPSVLKPDKSSAGILREPSKCILCGRCVRVCEELQCMSTVDFIQRGSKIHIGTAFNKNLNFSSCIQCGQCLIACPTGALSEKLQYPDLEMHLHDKSTSVIVQYSPITAYAVAEAFGLKAGKETPAIIETALRKIGFDAIFDSSFGSDVQIMELANEMLSRLKEKSNLPLISSCCPSWVKYVEQSRPEILPYLSSCKSSQQMMASLMKSYLNEGRETKASQTFSVSIMPCLSRKYESQRVEMSQKGIADIDAVITSRELIRLIKLNGINMQNLHHEAPDPRISTASSIGRLMGNTGGLSESLIRSLYFLLSGEEMHEYSILKLRGNKERKEYVLKAGGMELGFVALNGLTGVDSLLNEIAKGRKDIHFIEVMACKGGCNAGGGQPIHKPEFDMKQRSRTTYELDERAAIRAAHKNPKVNELYSSFLGEPLGAKCQSLLHTSFSKKDVLI